MNKTHIRTYAIAEHGDVVVNGYRKGDRIDLSKHYAEHPHPNRAEMRQEAHLDIYRYEDGQLAWGGGANGYDVPAALTFQFLLSLFLEDVEAEAGQPRAF
jgi:hypothetical protein